MTRESKSTIPSSRTSAGIFASGLFFASSSYVFVGTVGAGTGVSSIRDARFVSCATIMTLRTNGEVPE